MFNWLQTAGKVITTPYKSYDDFDLVEFAAKTDGVVVTNRLYRNVLDQICDVSDGQLFGIARMCTKKINNRNPP